MVYLLSGVTPYPWTGYICNFNYLKGHYRISRDTINNDLVFIGRCIDFATALANRATGPNHIEISDLTFKNLEDDCIYYKVQTGQRKKNMWESSIIEWHGGRYNTKSTIWQIQIE